MNPEHFEPFEPHLAKLVSATEQGHVLDLSSPSTNPLTPNSKPNGLATANGGQASTISGALIRSILMGLPIDIPGSSLPRLVTVTAAGLRIKAATITGQLDLEGLAGPGAAPLPGLNFDGCCFEGPINLRRCRLRSLSLRRCRLTELQAAEAVIDGPIDISEIRRPTEIVLKDCNCEDARSWGVYIVLTGAQIGGYVNCAGAHFAALTRPHGLNHAFVPNSRHPRYALDLRATQIRGSVILRPDVTALGGISFNLAHIQGSIWANGAQLTAVEDCAFSADYAEIQGSLYLRARDPSDKDESVRFLARGQVSLFATKLGGSLYMEGADLQRCRPCDTAAADEYESLDATNATIGGKCKLSWWQSFTSHERVYPFDATGRVVLNSASIGNDLILSGANVESVFAVNVSVGGECTMSVYGGPTSHPSERPRMSATAIHLEGAVIRGDLLMLGTRLGTEKETPDKEGHGLFARSAKIGGNCHLTTYTSGRDKEPPLRFECYGRVLLQEASIGNSLVMAGAKIDWTRAVPYPALDISGTTIGGHAKFMVWQSEESSECIRFEVDANDTALRLAGTRIAQKLILNGAMIRRSRIAINASNIEIGGKASLSSYGERGATKDREPVIFHFTASGRVILTAATIKLGLDMSGALLTPDVSASRGDDARSANNSVALDLTLARMKFLQLRGLAYSDTLATTTQRRKPFEALGSVVFRHAEIDTDIDLRGGLFRGRIVADYARVGGAVDLTGSRFSGGSARIIREQILRNSNKIGLDDSLLESAVRAELARHHAGKLMDADLSLHSARVGGALIVDNLTVQTEIDSVKGLERLNYVIADLRGLHIEELQDCGGNGWGNAIRFWLDGFRYTRLTPLPHSPTITSSRGRASRLLRQLIGPSWCAINAHRSDQLWKRRIKWLDLQYFDRDEPQMSEFTPGAYEQLVRTLNVDGSYEDARRIASAKLTQETIVSAKLSRKIIWGPFRLLFDYGLSPTRAVCTFILCIAIGAAAAEVADTGVSWFGGIGKVLVVNTNPPETLIVDEGSTASIHSIRGDKKSLYMDEVPCGDRIRPVLYALDVFVPVLDLRQQTACSIRHDRLLWRYAQAGYAVLGWFLTPLTLLTFSGILKRHLEK